MAGPDSSRRGNAAPAAVSRSPEPRLRCFWRQPSHPPAAPPARLDRLATEQRPVFVNLTAAWCITCLVNERVAISSDGVQRAFAARHVAYLKGDWTRQDPSITAYLRENGRDGVPLYVYYPPGDGSPTVLPQILTENVLLGELDRG
jgi:thiol:disulfide interchange protein DsbD